jgi:hypothetical protein
MKTRNFKRHQRGGDHFQCQDNKAEASHETSIGIYTYFARQFLREVATSKSTQLPKNSPSGAFPFCCSLGHTQGVCDRLPIWSNFCPD